VHGRIRKEVFDLEHQVGEDIEIARRVQFQQARRKFSATVLMSGDAVQDIPIVQTTGLYFVQNVGIILIAVPRAGVSAGRAMVVNPFGEVMATFPNEIIGYDRFPTLGARGTVQALQVFAQ
jgi:hypothetical protein